MYRIVQKLCKVEKMGKILDVKFLIFVINLQDCANYKDKGNLGDQPGLEGSYYL